MCTSLGVLWQIGEHVFFWENYAAVFYFLAMLHLSAVVHTHTHIYIFNGRILQVSLVQIPSQIQF